MRKYIILFLLLIAAPGWAAQQEITVVPDSPVLPSIGALKDALNLRLTAAESNFDELYAAVAAGALVIQTTAPADTTKVWIDTDQDNAIKVYITDTWTVVGSAAEDTLTGLSCDSGQIAKWNGEAWACAADATAEAGTGDDLGDAAYTDVVALWTTCTGFLLSDGTCVAAGTTASKLVQLNASAQLPAVSGALITGSWTGTLLSGQTTHTGAIQTIATELDSAVDLTFSTGLTDTSGTITVTYPVTAEAFSGSGWNGDTGGLARNDAYDYVHLFDTDDDGLPNKVDLSSAGIVKTDADGVLAVASAGTDYMTSTNLATGSTDNAVLRANGTGGKTTQASGVTIDDNNNMVVPGTIKSRVVFNTYSADQTLTAASHNSSVVQMTVAGEVTMWDCETANVGDSVMLWARDAEKIEVVPASGDQFYLFNGTGIGANDELDVAATAGTKVTLMCTADDSWSIIHETSTSTDGGVAD